MRAYKFRSVHDLDRVMDIFINRRLWCADVRRLNDIREADIRVGNDRGREVQLLDFGLNVSKAFSEWRVCSLCKTFDHDLLWAHYAGGSKGVAIEVSVPSTDAMPVTYSDDYLFLSEYVEAGVDSAVRAALTRKTKVWQYEQEVRIIRRSKFYDLAEPIHRVIIGSRVAPSVVRVLAEVCAAHGIRFERAVVADWGRYTVGVQELA
jgi:hypothetical protein